MKMNKKGFTLVEILAVITLLAIVLIIATPSVTGIIKNSQKDTFGVSVKNIGNTIENTMLEDKSIVCDNREYDIKELEMKNLSKYSGVWSCSNKLDSFEFKFRVTDGMYYVELTREDLEGDFDIEDYEGPKMKFIYTTSDRYQLGQTISLSINDVEVTNTNNVTFDVYENGKLLVSDVTEYEYTISKVVELEVRYKASNLAGKIDLNRKITVAGINLNDEILKDLTTEGNGLYEFGDDYRYSGTVTDNYVWYSGYLWRIMGLDDGSVKLVLEDSATTSVYNKFKIGAANYINSYAYEWLETLFLPTLNNKNIIGKQTTSCVDSTTDINSKKTTCNNKITSNLGLISLDEYNFAGGKNGYLNNNTYFYTITPGNLDYVLYVINEYGDVYNSDVLPTIHHFGLRPTITLAKGITFVEGNGTINNPYEIENDTDALENSYLANRFTGEYVTINNKLYRIVSTDSQGIKIVLDDVYKNQEGIVQEYLWEDTKTFSKDSGLGQILNNEIYNSLFTDKDKELLVTDATWYKTTYMKALDSLYYNLNSPLTNLNDKTDSVKATVGMLGVSDELLNQGMSGGVNNYWLLSDNNEIKDNYLSGNVYNWYIAASGHVLINYEPTSKHNPVRPVVYIRPSVKIESGEGTLSNPYKLTK